PHREKLKSLSSEVRDSIRVQGEVQQRIEIETKKQTPMIETMVASATRTPRWTALASVGCIFLACYLTTLFQQCSGAQAGALPFQRRQLGPPSATYPPPLTAPLSAPPPSVPPGR